jgi:hypothetical protein
MPMSDKTTSPLHWLYGVLLIVAVPSIACFGYYSLDSLGDVSSGTGRTLIVLAYPLSLLGLIGLMASAFSPVRRSWWVWSAAFCFAAPAAVLVLIRI